MADVNANIGVNIDTSNALAQLKALQRQISQFHTSVARSSETAALAQRDLQRNFINSVNAIGAFSAELRTVRTTAESFTDSLEKNKFSMREYFRFAGASTKTFGRLFRSEFDTIGKVAEDRVKKLQTQYIKLGRDSSGAMKAVAIIPNELDLKSFSTQTQLAAQRQAIFNQLVKQGSTNLLNFGKNTQWAGRQLMVGFTLPLASLGAVASKTFMEMEQAALKFRKVYGDLFTPAAEREQALADINALGRSFTQYGIAVSQTVNLAADAAAAGFQGLDLQRQVTEATRLQVLGQIDQQKALETTISLQNAFRLSNEDLSDSINFLNSVENQTVVSLDDITTAIPKVAPVIMQLGGNVKDLAFFLTAMKQGGVNASEGANALKSGLAALINPTEKASAMLAEMGVNIRQIVESNQGNLRQTVIEFATALDTLDPLNRARAIEQLFGKFQFARLSTLFENVVSEGTQAARVLELAGYSTEELAATAESELGMTAESGMNKFRKAIEDLRVALVPVGETFLQAVTPIVEFIGGILERFNNLSDGVKKAIVIMTVAIGAIGPVALMTFGLLANGLANVLKGALILRQGYLRLTGQSQVLGEQTDYLTTEQLNATAVAHSLDQSHAKLTQTFNVEAETLNKLVQAYQSAARAGANFAMNNPAMMNPPRKYNKGVVIVPGSGNRDTVPAMLTPGEAVIPADMTKKYGALINGMIAGNIPGYKRGLGTEDEGFIASIAAGVNPRSQAGIDQFLRRELQNIPEQLVQPFKDLVREIVREQKVSLESLKSQLRTFRGEYNRNIGQQERPQFAHIGAGMSMTAEELLQTGAIRQQKTLSNVSQFAEIFPTKQLGVKGGFGADIRGSINNAMQGVGASLQELIQEFQVSGIEKWRKSIEIGGGNFEQLIGQLNTFEQQVMSNLQQRLDAGATLIFDTTADIDQAEARAIAKGEQFDRSVSVSMEEVINQTIQNTDFFGSELQSVFDVANRTITEIRVNLSEIEKRLLQQLNPELYQAIGAGSAGGQPRLTPGGSASQRKYQGVGVLPSEIGAEVVQQVAVGAGTASPSKKTIPIGEDIARGLQVGMMNQVDDTQRVASELGSVATRLINPSTGRPFTPEERSRIVPQPVPSGTSIGDAQKQIAINEKTRDSAERQRRAFDQTSAAMSRLNGRLMGTTFAVGSISGALSAFGADLGGLSPLLFKVNAGLFALATTLQVFTNTQFLSLLTRGFGGLTRTMQKTKVGQKVAGTKAAQGTGRVAAGVAGRMGISGAAAGLGGVTAATGGTALIVLAALAAIATSIYAVNKAYKKHIFELERFGKAAFISATELETLNEALGTNLFKTGFEAPTLFGRAPETQQLGAKYEQDIKNTKELMDRVETLKKSTPNQAAAILASFGIELVFRGMSPKEAQVLLETMAKMSGQSKTLLNAKIQIDSINLENQLKEGTKIFELAFKPALAEINNSTKDLQKNINLVAGVASSAFNAVSANLNRGAISADKAQESFAAIRKQIQTLGKTRELIVLKQTLTNINPEFANIERYIKGSADAFVLLNAGAAGVELAPFINQIREAKTVTDELRASLDTVFKGQLKVLALTSQVQEAQAKLAEMQANAIKTTGGAAAELTAEENLQKQIEALKRLQAKLRVSAILEVAKPAQATFKNDVSKIISDINKTLAAVDVDLQINPDSIKNIFDIEKELKRIDMDTAEAVTPEYRAAQFQIEDLNDSIEQYNRKNDVANRQLSVLEERYQKQADALQEVADLQNYLANQQKRQITLADALSQGDISAAAAAAEEMRAEAAQFRLEQEQKSLENSPELLSLREQIKLNDEEIYKINEQIYKVQQESLKPVDDALKKLEREKILLSDMRSDYDSLVAYQTESLRIRGMSNQEIEQEIELLQAQLDLIQKNAQNAAETTGQYTQAQIDAQKKLLAELEAALLAAQTALSKEMPEDAGPMGWWKRQWERFKIFLTEDIPAFFANLPGMIATAAGNIWSGIKTFGSWLKEGWDSIVEWVKATPQRIATNIGNIWSLVKTIGTWLIETYIDAAIWLAGTPQRVATAIGGIWNLVKTFGTWLVEKWEESRIWLANLPYLLGQTVGNLWLWIKPFREWLAEKWEDAKEWLAGLPERTGRAVGNLWNMVQTFREWLIEKWENAKKWLADLPEKVKNTVVDLWGKLPTIKTYLSNVWSDFKEWLQSLPGKIASVVNPLNIFGSIWSQFTAGLNSVLSGGSGKPASGTTTTTPKSSGSNTVPDSSRPSITLPKDTTPKDTTPKDTTPKDTTPKDTTPKDTTPKDTTPKDTTPKIPSTVTEVKVVDGRTVITATTLSRIGGGGGEGMMMLAKGGYIKPKYMATGGFARGSDKIPAMLSPGEFVMSKYAVNNYGVDRLRAMNNGESENENVYNYSVNVNVKSGSNPEEIARTVMNQIKQIDSQRIRGQRVS